MIAAQTAPSPDKAWENFRARAALSGYTTMKNAAGWIVVGRYGHTTSFYTLAKAESWLDRTVAEGSSRE